MKQLVLGAALVGIGTVIGAYPQIIPTAQPTLSSLLLAFNQAMLCGIYPSSVNKDGSSMPSNGRVRACNMDKVSVVGERPAPRCSEWTVD